MPAKPGFRLVEKRMNILDAIVNAQDGAAVQQLGSQVGLAPDQATAALSALMPALAGAFQRNIQSQGGLESLMAALSSGNHGQYIDNPASLADPSAVTDGNGILGHLLGSKDVSRAVASRAAAQTGLSADVLKRMLPLVATLMMGAFSKQSGQPTSPGAALGGSGRGIAAMLTPFLDRNRDGSAIDDVTSLISGFMKRP
jgi:hypothetical protein